MNRLDQLLASLGYCSRREAKAYVRANDITLADGTPLKDSAKKVPAAEVRVNGEPLDHPDGLLLLVNKPLGLTCSHDPREAPLIYDLLPERWRARNPVVTTIGRLDKETSGLILLTDQTDLVHRLTSPKHKVPKIYRATLERDLDPALIDLFAAGTLQLDGEKAPCAPAILRIVEPRLAELTLIEGKYHQVRRMFAATGNTVTALHRTTFGEHTLGDLPPGHWRELPIP
ncbi:MAG: pseudouridine synthase [Verrucomicrobiota bacterium]